MAQDLPKFNPMSFEVAVEIYEDITAFQKNGGIWENKTVPYWARDIANFLQVECAHPGVFAYVWPRIAQAFAKKVVELESRPRKTDFIAYEFEQKDRQ